ncbi:GAF domain-containing SpoIIE family protein phosphatase [uncultured Treponema sp.]|uniref:GAF domain-containing SpoIIE family protein phosphatase n=1 Tax=uncultured Treponema sp. TaxID=162155 RepID=UPI0025CFA375|nr:GAF domain-containing SpoIIE family protein phosphatase [uncultured Treponema sp.]
MFTSDAISYVPLFGTAIVSGIIAVLLTIIKVRKTAKVSFIAYFALAVVIIACVYTALHPGMMLFALLLLLTSLLFIPYCIMLVFGKPQEFAKEEEVEEEVEETKPEVVVEEIQVEKIDLIQKGKAFVALAADSFSDKDGMQNLLDAINKTCIEVTKAHGGAILMVDEFEDLITVKSFTGDFPPPYKLPEDLPHKPLRVSTSFKYAQFPLRDNIFGEVATAGKAELLSIPKMDERIYENEPEDFLKLGSFIFIPLRMPGKDVVVGVLALSRNPDTDPFGDQEFDWAQTLAGFAESALKTALNFKQYTEKQELTKEADIASNIQLSLLPKKLPPMQGLNIGTYAEHTSGVCSDIYDVIPARQDRIAFIVMDVAGKGMNSLLVMAMIRSMFRLIVNTTQSAGTILSWANRGVCSELNVDHFASVALINYDPTKKKVQLSTGGSVPVYRYNVAKEAVEKLSVTCEPIGIEKTTSYKDIEFTASQGDIIICYTDGLVEALNAQGQQYSLASLTNIIKANAKLPGKDIANLVKTDIKKFIGNETLRDDQTLLVIKIQ